MSSEHKRPLYAFAIVALACAFFVGTGLKSEAFTSLLRVSQVSQHVAAGVVHIAGVPADVLRSTSTPTEDAVQDPRPASSETVADAPRPEAEEPTVVPVSDAASKGPGATSGARDAEGKKSVRPAGPGADARDRRPDATPRGWTHPGQGKAKGHGEGPRSKSRGHDRRTLSQGTPPSHAGAGRGHRSHGGADRAQHGKAHGKTQGKGHGKGQGEAHGKAHANATKGAHKKGQAKGHGKGTAKGQPKGHGKAHANATEGTHKKGASKGQAKGHGKGTAKGQPKGHGKGKKRDKR